MWKWSGSQVIRNTNAAQYRNFTILFKAKSIVRAFLIIYEYLIHMFVLFLCGKSADKSQWQDSVMILNCNS